MHDNHSNWAEAKPLSHAEFEKIFSYFVGFLIMLLNVSFAVQKIISLMLFHLSIFAWLACASGMLSKKSLPVPMPVPCNVSPMFSSNNLMVSGLRFRFLIHYELNFVYLVRYRSYLIVQRAQIPFLEHYFQRDSSFSREWF